jgi:hypothetical protein
MRNDVTKLAGGAHREGVTDLDVREAEEHEGSRPLPPLHEERQGTEGQEPVAGPGDEHKRCRFFPVTGQTSVSADECLCGRPGHPSRNGARARAGNEGGCE